MPYGHNPLRLIDQLVPSVAAVVDDLEMRFESQLSSSCGLNSGHFADNGRTVMLIGTVSRRRGQPALINQKTNRAPHANLPTFESNFSRFGKLPL
jgi:hypothetical protein